MQFYTHAVTWGDFFDQRDEYFRFAEWNKTTSGKRQLLELLLSELST